MTEESLCIGNSLAVPELLMDSTGKYHRIRMWTTNEYKDYSFQSVPKSGSRVVSMPSYFGNLKELFFFFALFCGVVVVATAVAIVTAVAVVWLLLLPLPF